MSTAHVHAVGRGALTAHPDATSPCYELIDHTKHRHTLCQLQGIDPMILVLARRHF